MFQIIKVFSVIGLVFFMLGEVQSQNDWELVSSGQNIEVYTKNNSHSGLKEVRVKVVFDASVETLMKELNDVSSYKDWVYKCNVSKKLQKNGKNDYIYYTESQMPALIDNRDLIVHSRQWTDEQGVTWSVSKSKARFVPEEAGIVRVTDFESMWKIKPLEDGRTLVDYTVSTDPGGNLPNWVINLGITVGPVKTMKNLQKRLGEKKYRMLASKLNK